MIRHIANCPFCEQGVIGLDCAGCEVVFNPDGFPAEPCPHLAALNVCLDAVRVDGDGTFTRLSPPTVDWLYVRGQVALQDARRAPGLQDLVLYLEQLCVDALPFPGLRPMGPRVIVGATAGQREAKRPRSGLLVLHHESGPLLEATLDGWAVYAWDPERLAAALPHLARLARLL